MPHSPAEHDPRPTPHGTDEGVQDPSADGPGPAGETSSDGPEATGEAADGEQPEFGDQKPTRFAADVEYRGRAGGHDYLVRVRHRLLDTSATVIIDGVEHDPKAEEKALKAAEATEKRAERDDEPAGAAPVGVESAGAEPDVEESDADQAPLSDDLRFRCEEGFSSLRITVRRPGSDGDHADAEVIKVRTVGLGGAGEVDVRRSFGRVLLVPADGTPSAAREEKRTAHPTRYALLSALATSARYLIPLLGLGALFSGLLDPLMEWVEARVRPALEAVAAFLSPIWDWFSELTRPVREFLAALLRPVTEFRDWLVDLLFGWIPELSLPFSIPEWVVDVAIPVVLVLVVFVGTFRELRRRRKRLEATRNAPDEDDEEKQNGPPAGVEAEKRQADRRQDVEQERPGTEE